MQLSNTFKNIFYIQFLEFFSIAIKIQLLRFSLFNNIYIYITCLYVVAWGLIRGSSICRNFQLYAMKQYFVDFIRKLKRWYPYVQETHKPKITSKNIFLLFCDCIKR